MDIIWVFRILGALGSRWAALAKKKKKNMPVQPHSGAIPTKYIYIQHIQDLLFGYFAVPSAGSQLRAKKWQQLEPSVPPPVRTKGTPKAGSAHWKPRQECSLALAAGSGSSGRTGASEGRGKSSCCK